MGWQDKLKDILKTAQTVAPILAAFKVPGAKTVSEAVEKIHLDGERSNDDAVELLAAASDNHEKRIVSLEKALKELRKK